MVTLKCRLEFSLDNIVKADEQADQTNLSKYLQYSEPVPISPASPTLCQDLNSILTMPSHGKLISENSNFITLQNVHFEEGIIVYHNCSIQPDL